MGNLDVRIRHGGGGGPDYRVVLVIAAVLLVASGSGTAAATADHLAAGLVDFLMWTMLTLAGAIMVGCALAFVFRAKIRSLMVRKGDPRNELDAVIAGKREELAKIRAMRLQIEAARIAGVEITPDILAMAEDPELADLVMRFRAAAAGRSEYLAPARGEVTT